MKLIPAIDIIDGKCVRLQKGDYQKVKVYDYAPLEVAKQFVDAGLTHLHLVDLDGARAGQIVNWKVLESICAHTPLMVDFGGGIKQDDDLRIAFESGAVAVNIGSAAVKHPERFQRWLHVHGSQRIMLSADVKEGHIAIHGWQANTHMTVEALIRQYQPDGLTQVVCTDISKDGMLEGPGFDLYRHILGEVSDIQLVASGGVRSLVDLEQLRKMGMAGAIIGKAIYEGYIKLEELSTFQV